MTTESNSEQNSNEEQETQEVTKPVVPAKKKLPQAKSLGTLAKRQDYIELLSQLKELEQPEFKDQREIFYNRPEGDFPSEMDKLLVALISYMKPLPEPEVDNSQQQQFGVGTGMSSQTTIAAGVAVGMPIAPPIGMHQPEQKNITWNKVNFEDISTEKFDIPLAGLECIDFLLEKGVNPNVCTMAGLNAVLIACSINNEEPLKKLLNNPFQGMTDTWETYKLEGNFGHSDVLGNDPLAYAILTNSFYMADYLINEMGCDVNKKYFRMHDQTLLHIVAERFNYKGEAHPLQGFLYNYEENSNENKIVYLLEKGADPSLKDMNGKVPEEYIPFKSEELEEELGKISPEEEKCWDRCFHTLGSKRKEIQALKKTTRKLSF